MSSWFVSLLKPITARRLLAVLAVAMCLGQVGCVRRRMMIVTNPPGALVYVDDYEIGVTPISTDFTYYGKRKIRLVKDGYETLTVMQKVPAPWYQIPPLDFVTENFIPGEIRDRQTFAYTMTPQVIVPPEQLLGRAEDLRRQARRSGVTTVSGTNASEPWPAPGGYVPGGPELIPAPQGIGGQQTHDLPPGGM